MDGVKQLSLSSVPDVNNKVASTRSVSFLSFGELFSQAIEKLNQSQVKADNAIKDFLAGGKQDLHQVMIALKEAEITMQLAVQVRNKIVEAYQEISRMPI
ncbi:MAG: flagellar hook-basal body complex protein FliE [Peptococcaceae bacterium]|nr:flagellar hook-basal body complex protein FliE [Peptococcaceae bacterium]